MSGCTAPEGPQAIVHASAVALAGRGLLIRGASGSGKSSLALALLAFGAQLVSDDRVVLRQEGDRLRASCPDAICGLIEARGVGLLCAEPAPPTIIAAIVDLDHIEADRLPPSRRTDLLGVNLPLLHKSETTHFPAALVQYLTLGRKDTE
jgi:HPr kinase/phosphorylase